MILLRNKEEIFEFADKLKRDSVEIMKDKSIMRSLKKIIVRQKPFISFDYDNRPFYEYYDAFCPDYDSYYYPGIKNESGLSTYISVDDPRLKILEKAITDGKVIIKVDDKFEYGDGSLASLEDLMMWSFTFFYQCYSNKIKKAEAVEMAIGEIVQLFSKPSAWKKLAGNELDYDGALMKYLFKKSQS